jgi:hypothetical protein
MPASEDKPVPPLFLFTRSRVSRPHENLYKTIGDVRTLMPVAVVGGIWGSSWVKRRARAKEELCDKRG